MLVCMMHKLLAFFALLALWLASPLWSQSTPAMMQDDVLAAKILTGWRMADGHHMAGLQLTLAPDWKTYWRAPGEAGIPPQFDWSGSQNVKSVLVHWPTPSVFHTNGLQTIGYHNAVVLPIEITPRDPAQPVLLRVEVALGVCKDICMPATLQLDADLGGPNQDEAAINAALSKIPHSADQAGVRAISCTVAPIKDGIRLSASITMPSRGVDETVVFESQDSTVWVAEATSQRAGSVLSSVAEFVGASGAPFALQRSGITITVLGDDRAVEITGCPAP